MYPNKPNTPGVLFSLDKVQSPPGTGPCFTPAWSHHAPRPNAPAPNPPPPAMGQYTQW